MELTASLVKKISRPHGIIFGAVKRGEEISLLSGGDQIQKGDTLVVYSLSDDIPKLEDLMKV